VALISVSRGTWIVVSDADVRMRDISLRWKWCPLFARWRIREGIVQALLRIVKADPGAHFTAHLPFAVGAARDVHVTRGVGQFQAEVDRLRYSCDRKAPLTEGPLLQRPDNDGRK